MQSVSISRRVAGFILPRLTALVSILWHVLNSLSDMIRYSKHFYFKASAQLNPPTHLTWNRTQIKRGKNRWIQIVTVIVEKMVFPAPHFFLFLNNRNMSRWGEWGHTHMKNSYLKNGTKNEGKQQLEVKLWRMLRYNSRIITAFCVGPSCFNKWN